ncbi:MAG: glycosyltransferase family 2 protein [Bacteriovoracaceae bacterium]
MDKKVSVVVPCRNESKNIQKCIDSILNSDYPQIEVIVVDGMSTDGTREILAQNMREHKNFKFIDNPHQLTPYAFNLGIKNSDGFYVQIVGSRNILDRDYISKLVAVLESHSEIACVGGNYQHRYESDLAKYISWAMESKFGVGASNYRTMKESCCVDTVGIPLYRRAIFDELGFFDERLTRNQDDDFNFRVTKAGHKIWYEASANTQYYVRSSFSKLFKQMSQYGYFKVFVNKKHKTFTTLRQLVPISFLIYLVIFPIVSFFIPLLWFVYFGVLFIYGALGFLSALSFTAKFMEIIKVQYAILVMHIGYGWGYLKGIWDFILLGRNPANSMQQQTT